MTATGLKNRNMLQKWQRDDETGMTQNRLSDKSYKYILDVKGNHELNYERNRRHKENSWKYLEVENTIAEKQIVNKKIIVPLLVEFTLSLSSDHH